MAQIKFASHIPELDFHQIHEGKESELFLCDSLSTLNVGLAKRNQAYFFNHSQCHKVTFQKKAEALQTKMEAMINVRSIITAFFGRICRKIPGCCPIHRALLISKTIILATCNPQRMFIILFNEFIQSFCQADTPITVYLSYLKHFS